MNRLLVFIGPSGVGKSTIVHELLRQNVIHLLPTWTDRPKRNGEDEPEHVFVDSDEFDSLQHEEFFVEVVTPFNLPYRYGLPKRALKEQAEGVPVLMLRAQFIEKLRQRIDNFTIYQIEAAKERVEEVLKQRNENDIGSRLLDFEEEIKNGRAMADRVFTNTERPESLTQEIIKAISADFTKDTLYS